MRTTPTNLLDDSFFHIERPGEPWNIHLEVGLEGRVNPQRLATAIEAAGQTHPMARARLAPHGAMSTAYHWDIPDRFDAMPLAILKADDEEAVQAHREQLVSLQPPSNHSPAFAVSLIQGPVSDTLLIMLNHVLADGLSTFRLINSIMRHYAGEPDPVPDFDPLSRRDLKSMVGSRSVKETIERASILAKHLLRSASSPQRVAPECAKPDEGYGCVLQGFTAQETQAFMARRQKPATVNDMLIAGMLMTIHRWNAERSGGKGRISTLMPVNVRPQEWWFEVLGNYSSYVSVSLEAKQLSDFGTAVSAVNAQTEQLKHAGAAGILVDLLDIPKFLPSVLKGRLKDITPTLGRNLVESTWVSNIGRLGEAPSMGDAGKVTSLYFSPPAPVPMGMSLGIASMESCMYLSYRYRRAVLDGPAAKDFAKLCKTVLLGAS